VGVSSIIRSNAAWCSFASYTIKTCGEVITCYQHVNGVFANMGGNENYTIGLRDLLDQTTVDVALHELNITPAIPNLSYGVIVEYLARSANFVQHSEYCEEQGEYKKEMVVG
jgi:hypothetical protein